MGITRYDWCFYCMDEEPEGSYVLYDDMMEMENALKNALKEIDRLRHIMNELLPAEEPAELPIEVGEYVIRKDNQYLRSGASTYEGAVVISVKPFAIASTDGDMLWQHQQPGDFLALCLAQSSWREAAMRRLKDVKQEEQEEQGGMSNAPTRS